MAPKLLNPESVQSLTEFTVQEISPLSPFSPVNDGAPITDWGPCLGFGSLTDLTQC